MPSKLSDVTIGKILYLRAVDYDKSEIASELGIHRKTVTRHLRDLQREAELSENGEVVVIRYLFKALYGGDPKTVPELLVSAVLHDLDDTAGGFERLLEDRET